MKRRVLTALLLLVFSATARAQAPSISSLSPSSGAVGTVVTISGENFGGSQGLTSTVTFGGVVAAGRGRPAQSWTATAIKVAVPSGATTGNIVVTVSGQASNGVNFAVIPVIQSVSPTSGLAGTAVSVTGTGFGNSQPQGPSTVTFNGVAANPSSWGSTGFSVPVPSGASAGNLVVTVGGQTSNGVLFTPTPVINTLTPNSGVSGIQVTILGSSFGGKQGTSTVTFNGVAAPVSAWSNSSITVNAPSGAQTGNVVVAVNGIQGAGQTFTYTPQITSVSPNPALAGTTVSITGNNFGGSQGTSTVAFNGVAAAVSNWNNTSISAIVPGNATAGNVVVTVNGVNSNGQPFSFPPPYAFSVSYAPNGSVLTANDSVNGNWTYTYDDFNRLSTASNTNPVQSFSYTYDEYGNRWQQEVTSGSGGSELLTFTPAVSASTNGTCYHAAGVTNQPDGFCFDAAGNLLSDGHHSYTYDAENRVVAVDGGQTATYAYNVDGQRIQKVTPAGTADYLYDLNGHVITELDGFGTVVREEIYSNGRHLATYNNGATYFVQADRLGTERARVLPSGNLFETCISLPYGDGLNCNGSTDPSPAHFTGKPRDSETNLDYFGARFYSNAMGRFVTSDWAAKPTTVPFAVFGDPQTLNLYKYSNNPVTLADIDGHQLPTQAPQLVQDSEVSELIRDVGRQIAQRRAAAAAILGTILGVEIKSLIDSNARMNYAQASLTFTSIGLYNDRILRAQAEINKAAESDPEVEAASGGARNFGRGGKRRIGLGLDQDLKNFSLRFPGAVTSEKGGWQRAGLTVIPWVRAWGDPLAFQASFIQAASNASQIVFDVSHYNPSYPDPGMTTWELNYILNHPDLLNKTIFVQNGQQVYWNGNGFVTP